MPPNVEQAASLLMFSSFQDVDCLADGSTSAIPDSLNEQTPADPPASKATEFRNL
jgi:hypothetical protein